MRYFIDKGANVVAYDHQAMNEAKKIFGKDTIKYAKDSYSAAKDADCVCVLTEWEEFKKLDLKRLKKHMRFPLVADGRNIFNLKQMKREGFEYLRIGGQNDL